MSTKLRGISMFSGNTILGDGAVIMIVDPNGVVQAFGATVASQLAAVEAAAASRAAPEREATSLLLFRAGSNRQKAVPLALITRLEEVDAKTIELSNGRHMVQYRGHLMPLVGLEDKMQIKGEGAQPLLVFSDGARSMALVVDEIVDIVEEHLDIEPSSASPGVLGSAIVRGQATEIIDVGHFVPAAFADWFRGQDKPSRRTKPSVLLVDDSPFFRNMLAPVLQAAGYEVTAVGRAAEALEHLFGGRMFDAVITDIEMPETDGFALTERLRADSRTSHLPIIALSSIVTPESVERGRSVGLDDYVAKFDRPGLIAALKEQIGMNAAA
jgi:two-component system chemotaxis sensor kinase CheA